MVEVEPAHLAHHDADVALALESGAQGRGDLVRREGPRRDLVEQRLEEVKVAAIDQRHLDRRPAKAANDLQAGKAAAHDDDPMALVRLAHARDRRTGPAVAL
jgi:hypothetical protein